jgi:hypothetical protein
MKITNNYQLNKSESHHEESQEIDSKDAKTASIAYSALIAPPLLYVGKENLPPFFNSLQAWVNEGKTSPEHLSRKDAQIKILFSYHSPKGDGLSLSCLGLTSLSDCIGQLPNLRTLDLSCNQLTDLPPNIFSKLSNLQWLDLSNNQLTGLTNVFNNQTQLKHLILFGNQLTDLSDDVFRNLPDLEVLDLRNNQLTTTPNVSKNLLRCYLEGNPFLNHSKSENSLNSNFQNTLSAALRFFDFTTMPTKEALNQKYKNLMLAYHPDKSGDDELKAKQINHYREILTRVLS